MKHVIGLLLLIPMLFLAAHAEDSAALAGTYKYEGEGFGGDFTITLNADGTYEFYEGPLSSYMGMGTWYAADDVIHMAEGDAGFQGDSGDGSHVSVPTVPSRQSINGDGPSRYEIRIRKNGNHTAGADRYRRSSGRSGHL